MVPGLGVGEGLFKLRLPGGIRGEGEAGAALPFGVQLGKARRQVLGGLPGLGFLLGPLRAPQLVEPGPLLFLSPADILAHQVQLGHRHIQAVAPGVVDLDIVLFHAVHRHPLDAHEAADAMVHMHHQVAGGQVGEGLQLLAVGVLFQLQLFLGGGRQLALRQHRQLQGRPLAACGQGPNGDPQLAGLRHSGPLQIQHSRDSPLLQEPQQVLRPDLTAAQHQHSTAGVPVVLQVRDGGLQTAAVRAELPGVDGQQAVGL